MKFHLDCYLDERETSDSRGGEEKALRILLAHRARVPRPDEAALFNASGHSSCEQTCLDDDRPCL